jgi:glycosyltransferase involved in cell wall biosynthesis
VAENDEVPLVAVWMVTYNQEKYIARAFEGILMQKVDFKLKIFIGDDCSTDNTMAICLKYESENPDILRVIANSENNIWINAMNIYETCLNSGAKYIAMCEGDDYWTDSFKLQKQVDFLEENPTIFGCYHDVQIVDENNIVIKENYYKPHKEVFDQEDCLVYGGTYSTSSLVFRGEVLNDMPKWFLKSSSDYSLDLLITEYGKIAHIEENMGRYRIHSGGLWQGNSEVNNVETVIKRYQICLTNEKFKRRYGDFFYERIAHLSRYLVAKYINTRQFGKRLKYITYYIYYTRPKSKALFGQLFGTMLFPSLYKWLKSFSSKGLKNE